MICQELLLLSRGALNWFPNLNVNMHWGYYGQKQLCPRILSWYWCCYSIPSFCAERWLSLERGLIWSPSKVIKTHKDQPTAGVPGIPPTRRCWERGKAMIPSVGAEPRITSLFLPRFSWSHPVAPSQPYSLLMTYDTPCAYPPKLEEYKELRSNVTLEDMSSLKQHPLLDVHCCWASRR